MSFGDKPCTISLIMFIDIRSFFSEFLALLRELRKDNNEQTIMENIKTSLTKDTDQANLRLTL